MPNVQNCSDKLWISCSKWCWTWPYILNLEDFSSVFVHLGTLFIYLFIYLFIHLFIYLFIYYLFIHANQVNYPIDWFCAIILNLTILYHIKPFWLFFLGNRVVALCYNSRLAYWEGLPHNFCRFPLVAS